MLVHGLRERAERQAAEPCATHQIDGALWVSIGMTRLLRSERSIHAGEGVRRVRFVVQSRSTIARTSASVRPGARIRMSSRSSWTARAIRGSFARDRTRRLIFASWSSATTSSNVTANGQGSPPGDELDYRPSVPSSERWSRQPELGTVWAGAGFGHDEGRSQAVIVFGVTAANPAPSGRKAGLEPAGFPDRTYCDRCFPPTD